MAFDNNYFVYIVCNKWKNVLYTGITNDIERRMYEHENGLNKGFTKRFNCKFLIYYEHFTDVMHAIDREKEIKKFRREKKDKIITAFNPDWEFLNENIAGI